MLFSRVACILILLCIYMSFTMNQVASEANNVQTVANATTMSEDEERVYFMKKITGAGCPYTASWLIHTNLYRKTPWWIDITKMEAASFNVFDKAKMKFQLSDPDAYYVHHMSMFEHLIHKKHGFETAQNKTLIMSKAAYAGECSNVKINTNQQYVALIPFYGGLPPNVTKDLSVKSIGQGNSLVDASTKGLQAMATVCSCLKYFGKVFIGVARDEDKEIILRLINNTDPIILDYVNVIQFKTHKPAFLPFHMIAWGQSFVKHYNCQLFYDTSVSASTVTSSASGHHEDMKGFHVGQVDTSLVEEAMKNHPSHAIDYEICAPNSFPKPHGSPIKVTYVKNPNLFVRNSTSPPIRFVYYTECDQIVKFDSWTTFTAISAALNETTLFSGRRKEKNAQSDPEDYMGMLNLWRECGTPGYTITWPKSHHVQQETNV